MDLSQLEHFKAVAETENMSKAAERIFVTQSALSKSVAKLEAELGTQFFDRTKNRIALNDAGELMLEHVNRVLSEIDSLRGAVKEYSRKNPKITISASSIYFLRYCMPAFSASYSDVAVDVHIKSNEELERDLLAKKTDVAISSRELHSPFFKCHSVFPDVNYISVPTSNPLSKKEHIRMEDLAGQRILRPVDELMKRTTAYFKRNQIPVEIIPVEDYTLFRELLPKTDYLAFAGYYTLDYHKALRQRRVIPIENYADELRFKSYVYYHTDREETARPFLEWMRENVGLFA